SGGPTFQGKCAPAVMTSDLTFATQAYADVFNHPGTSAQVQHFVDQLNFYISLYTNSGAFGTDPIHIDLLSRAAIYGQMLGVAAETPGTAGSSSSAQPLDGVHASISLVGFSAMPDLTHGGG